MLDSRAFIHVACMHSYDKDFRPHMEAAERDAAEAKVHLVPEHAVGARIPPHSRTYSQQAWVSHDYQAWGLSKSTE